MDISVALPMRSWDGKELEGFAKMADEGPFAAVNVGERLCYDNHDPLIALAMLGALTKRIRLMTGIVVLPIHEPVSFAKQVASLDRLTGGRLVLGLGVGPRKPDFDATQSNWHDRGKRFEAQVAIMRRVWSGQPPYDKSELATEPVSPPVQSDKDKPWTWAPPAEGTEPVPPFLPAGRPPLIFGGFADVPLRRAGRLADGFHSFDFAPDVVLHQQRYRVVQQAWDDAARPGKPWLIASTFFSLGPNAREIYDQGMREFYGYTEEMHKWASASNALTSPQAIRDAVKRFEDAGVDEMLFATSHHLGPEALGWLADAIG